MAATAASYITDGPVLSLINKRIRGLRKKYNRILQMEESISQGKSINKEQEEVLRSKPTVSALIDELEKLRQPLSSAVKEEVHLALQNNQISLASQPLEENHQKSDEPESKKEDLDHVVLEDIINLLYFGSLFDVKSQNDFTSTMLTRTHERGCCLTYDYVTDDATDLLGEKDLDLIAMLSSQLMSRPADSSLSHKNALQQCVEHAKPWLAKAEQPIEPNVDVTYANLREKLNKIMSSEYFTTSPEMKAPVEVAASAAAGNYASFQVPLHDTMVATSVPVEVDGVISQSQEKIFPDKVGIFRESDACSDFLRDKINHPRKDDDYVAFIPLSLKFLLKHSLLQDLLTILILSWLEAPSSLHDSRCGSFFFKIRHDVRNGFLLDADKDKWGTRTMTAWIRVELQIRARDKDIMVARSGVIEGDNDTVIKPHTLTKGIVGGSNEDSEVVDAYMAEVVLDANLSLSDFIALAR
ncbi:uncharacterized protein LOC129322455 [Prosopis cineraria]|uniref:uncharacterized protein LOC129322455 n=1 Tax=Prosopis cineraria TaxID=364024 RepID=UPI00240EA3DD|nr:uncharacterized protein LOC129322455 [Prosopis cineraria]